MKIQHAHARQQVHLWQMLMRMPAQGAIHQPLAVLDIDGKTIDQRLLFIALGNEIEAVLDFGVQHVLAPVREKADREACLDDERVTDEI